MEDYKNGGYKSFTGGEEMEVKKDFEVLEVNDNVYTVKNKSFGGNIKANVTIVDGKVTNLELLEFDDTCISKEKTNHYYTCPEYLEDEYINKLVNDNDIDTVSGATISSTSLKEILEKTLEVYNER
jgi:uncharacterized protein with FMN-binding domain